VYSIIAPIAIIDIL